MNGVKIPRRCFLRGAGGVTLGLPILASLMPYSLRAATNEVRRRFVAIKSYSTQRHRDWYPTKKDNGYQLKDDVFVGYMNVDAPNGGTRYTVNPRADGTTHLTQPLLPGQPYTWAPLVDFAQPSLSRLLGRGYTPFLPKLTLLRGLDFPPDTNHNAGGMLGNYHASNSAVAKRLAPVPTIDQVLAFSSKFYPTAPRLRSLHLSPGGSNSISFTNDGNPNSPVRQVQARMNPLAAYLDVFGGPGAGQHGLPKLNTVFADYRRHASHPRIGAEDRQLLERHMQFLTELEGRVNRAPTEMCTRPATPQSIPNDPPGSGLVDVESIKATYEIMTDTLVAAILCDHTRVITLDVRKALSVSDGRLTGWHHDTDGPGSWHGAAHSFGKPVEDRNIFEINKWIADEIFLRVIQKLNVPEGDGSTYLDNSVVFWGNELGFNHTNIGVPALLAGGGGGKVNTGRYLDYTDWQSRSYYNQEGGNAIQGIAHNRLLVSILQAMGLAASDYERDGKPGYGAYSTDGKPAGLLPVAYDRDQGAPLPGLLI